MKNQTWLPVAVDESWGVEMRRQEVSGCQPRQVSEIQLPQETISQRVRRMVAGQMLHRVKAMAAKSDNLSLILRTHMVGRENQLLQAVPRSQHGAPWKVHSPLSSYIKNK